jgi:hypothetical protein
LKLTDLYKVDDLNMTNVKGTSLFLFSLITAWKSRCAGDKANTCTSSQKSSKTTAMPVLVALLVASLVAFAASTTSLEEMCEGDDDHDDVHTLIAMGGKVKPCVLPAFYAHVLTMQYGTKNFIKSHLNCHYRISFFRGGSPDFVAKSLVTPAIYIYEIQASHKQI